MTTLRTPTDSHFEREGAGMRSDCEIGVLASMTSGLNRTPARIASNVAIVLMDYTEVQEVFRKLRH